MAKVLIIDDENNIRMMMRLALQHVGHTVETAADGYEGLAKFGEGGLWDLVVLDQRMPGMEGLEVLREIRRLDPQAKVVMATAFGTIDLAVEAMKIGATDFLRKPFTAEVLRGAVQAVLTPVATPMQTEASGYSGVTFGITTINGYRIESEPGTGILTNGDLRQTYRVRSPEGEERVCSVVLPAYVIELVKAHADREAFPGGDRFWHALAEENLANYVWQNAEFPPGDTIRVEDLSSGMRRWIDTVLAA